MTDATNMKMARMEGIEPTPKLIDKAPKLVLKFGVMKLLKDKTGEEIARDRKYRREHYYRNKERYLAKQKVLNKRAANIATQTIQALKKPCFFCQEADPCCIDFHHLIPSEKSFAVSRARGAGLSPERIIAEAKKCVCLCANCHRKLHAGKLALPAGIAPA